MTTIQDFGEHIPGARKDIASRKLEDGLHADPGFRRTLSEAWPTPAWRDICGKHADDNIPKQRLACVRAVRDQLRTKHGRRYEQQTRHREGATHPKLREIALAVLDGKLDVDDALKVTDQLTAPIGTYCRLGTALYTELGHDKDLHGYNVIEPDSRGNRVSEWRIYGRKINHGSGSGSTLIAAVRNLRENMQERDGHEVGEHRRARSGSNYSVRYRVVNDESLYGVWRRAAGGLVCVRECDDLDDARNTIAEKEDELDAWWERWKRIPETRRRENAMRQPATNEGTDDPERFTARYRFRGVQFGNWVENSRRHRDLTETSEALNDLARVLQWPLGGLTLNGALGLAFGARGKGGAGQVRAHYEPTSRVIAISKPAGAGSLAHEWFHALDNHVALLGGQQGSAFATENRAIEQAGNSNRLAQALATFGYTVRRTHMKKRAEKLDKRRPRAKRYWSTVIEMTARAFEAWVIQELARQGIRNDYLANIVDAQSWKVDPEMDHAYPYPYADELTVLSPVIEQIAIEGKTLLCRSAA